MAGSKPTVFLYFFTKRWRQGPSLPVLVLKPAVTVGFKTGSDSFYHYRFLN
jgi:hypothetical protein